MKKTIVYVDGGNLYFGLARPAGMKWLDLMALSRRLLIAEHEVDHIVYFASRVIDKTADHHKSARQDKYFDALRKRSNTEIVEGICGIRRRFRGRIWRLSLRGRLGQGTVYGRAEGEGREGVFHAGEDGGVGGGGKML